MGEFEQYRKRQQPRTQSARNKDQSLDITRTTGWGLYDESAASFAYSFRDVLHSQTLPEFLKGRFPDKAGNLVMVEFLGSGYNLANDLRGQVKTSYSVSLTDSHLPLKNSPPLSPDLDHTVIAGDFSDPQTQRKLIQRLDGNTVDFWIERGGFAWE